MICTKCGGNLQTAERTLCELRRLQPDYCTTNPLGGAGELTKLSDNLLKLKKGKKT